MSNIMKSMQLRKDLLYTVPDASTRTYSIGHKVLSWRKKVINSRIREGIGSFEVEEIDLSTKIAFIRDDVNLQDFPSMYHGASRASRPKNCLACF